MGETIDMRVAGYHLTESVGTGGMGSVFKATVEADGKPVPKGTTVAVKLLHPHLRSVGEFVKRFHREAKLAAQIDHPNVVRVLDEGEEDRKHYIVMEYAEGLKLSDLIGDSQPLSPQQTIEIMNQVCEALKAAARVEAPDEPGRVRSLVHRDIKPDNLIIQPLDRKQFDTMTRTGDKTALAAIRVKLLDFGLAKDVKALSTILSQTGQSLGTPAYMSPEQCRGGDVDPRSDIYSLGVVAYHMITGTQPFAGPTTVAYAQQHAEEIPPDILKRNPMCPKNLADCIYRCIAKDVKDRYATPAELQADLVRVAKGQTVTRIHRFRKKGSFSGKKVGAIAAISIALALTAVAGGWYWMTDRAKADIAQAIQKADVAIGAQDYAGAKKALEEAIAAVPNRPDKAELTAPAQKRLQEIAAKAAEQEAATTKAEAERKQREKESADIAAKSKHEQDAIAAVAGIKAKTAAGDYQQAIDAANTAIKDFSDTPSGKDLPDLLATATEKLKGEQAAKTAKDQAEQDRLAAEARTKHERFIKYRDEGDAAFTAAPPNYRAAKTAYEKALAEETDPVAQKRLDICVERTTKQRIAVIDFTEKGQVGIPEAGKTVAELLLAKFGQDRYQLVERSQLSKLLNEIDLTMALVQADPEKVYGKLKGVKYLVLGSVNKLGNITVTARIVDVIKGDLLQTADVSAEDARGVQDALSELAKVLQMTAEEKKAYLDERLYPQLLSDARSKTQAKDFEGAMGLYRRALAIRSTVEVEDELKKVLSDKAAWEKLQADERRMELDFQRLFTQAKAIVDVLPADKERLSAAQKADVQTALKAIQAALVYKPFDRTTLALKDKIDSCLGPAKELTLDLGNKVTMKLALIPAGKFMMGSPAGEKDRSEDEGPQREVTISKPCYMGVYTVTQEQYEQVMGKNPSNFKGAQNPVESVSWDDAVEFCKKLSVKTGKTVRLPTEAEWEYACRAGSKTRFSYGDDNDYANLGDYAWYTKNSGEKTHAVGQKKPNDWGLYDMHGNVWQWCSDWYSDSYANANKTDPTGLASGTIRVLRGGCWSSLPQRCRSAHRYRYDPVIRDSDIGFRVALDFK